MYPPIEPQRDSVRRRGPNSVRSYHRGLFISLVALCAVGAIAAWQATRSTTAALAQEPAPHSQPAASQPSSQPEAVFKVQAKLVLVDSVVTDKKGNYIRGLTQNDFRVWEDGKEQTIKSFSYESDNGSLRGKTKHYLVLLFDNSNMDFGEQSRARLAAAKFIDANAGPDRLVALADFGGMLRITQNFTSDAGRLKKMVAGITSPDFVPSLTTRSQVAAASAGIQTLANAEAEFGVRNMFLAVRELAKNLAPIPGRKSLVLLTSGFPLTSEMQTDLIATIDTCNKANVAVYPIDARGLAAFVPTSRLSSWPDHLIPATFRYAGSADPLPHLILAQHGPPPPPPPTPHPPTPAPPPKGGNINNRSGYNTQPSVQPRAIVPQIPPSASTNQEVLYALADGTGGFVILNTNDLLGGMQRIAEEQSEYYILAYAPPSSPDRSCHVLRVKVQRGGTIVRSRSGYCNVKPVDFLAGKPIEHELENYAAGSQPSTASSSLETPFFFTSANVARVSLAMEVPSSSIRFAKEKGEFRSDVNVLGIARKSDGSEAARFSDTVHLKFEKQQLARFNKELFHYENQFDIVPGQYRLTVVFGSGAESLGKLEAPLAIDSYDGKQLSLSSLALSKELHPVSQTQGELDADLMEGHTPLVIQGMQLVLAADHQFKKTDPAMLYVEVYEPLLTGANPPKLRVEMKILDVKTGKAQLDIGINDTQGLIKMGNPVVPIGLKIPVEKLAPGSYRLELRALDSAGNGSSVRAAEFVVD
jgi:VWFA-related protein